MSDLIEEDVSANYADTNLAIGREWTDGSDSKIIVKAITSPGDNEPHKVYFSYLGAPFDENIGAFIELFKPVPSNEGSKTNQQILSEYISSKSPKVQAEILGTGASMVDTAKEPRLFIEKPLIRATHPYGFRSGEWATIADMVMVTSINGTKRLNYMVMFDDGKVDYWPVCDESNYEIKAASEVGK
ncbi:MAG: hypothetical protein ACTHU5_00935 [Psychrobacter sp.]